LVVVIEHVGEAVWAKSVRSLAEAPEARHRKAESAAFGRIVLEVP
jgi:hypothetical protein